MPLAIFLVMLALLAIMGLWIGSLTVFVPSIILLALMGLYARKVYRG